MKSEEDKVTPVSNPDLTMMEKKLIEIFEKKPEYITFKSFKLW